MPKQPIISIYSHVSMNKELVDFRRNTFGFKFGKIADIVKQYGISVIIYEGSIKFSAPKSRLQYLIEKLHFSKTPYFSC